MQTIGVVLPVMAVARPWFFALPNLTHLLRVPRAANSHNISLAILFFSQNATATRPPFLINSCPLRQSTILSTKPRKEFSQVKPELVFFLTRPIQALASTRQDF
jgi:hypothetical protein